MRLIPAIDIIDKKCVRLAEGDFNRKTVYSNSPLDVAKEFEDSGIEYLHLVDLDGAKLGKITNYDILEQIATKTNLKIDFGGGLGSNEDLKMAFESGAKQITAGSIAVKNKALVLEWIDNYGVDQIILGADSKNGMIATGGWLKESEKELIPFIDDYVACGIQYCISTDISKDGMLLGPSIELYNKILSLIPKLKLIASGGVSNLDDLYNLKEIGCEGAIIGKAIYENRISLKELEQFNLENKDVE